MTFGYAILRRGHIGQRLVVPPVVVVLNERRDLGLEILRAVVVVQQQDVLQRSVVGFDLPLGHWVVGLAPGMREPPVGQVLFQLPVAVGT